MKWPRIDGTGSESSLPAATTKLRFAAEISDRCPTMRKAALVLGDDHPLLLSGIKQLLEPDFEVAGTAGDGRALLDLVLELNPDVIVLDISMPLLDGIEVARRIHITHPCVKIVFLSMHGSLLFRRKALDAGAQAYVLKARAAEELRKAILAVVAGGFYASPKAAGDGVSMPHPETGREENELTERQLEILELIADGLPSKQIAHALQISIKTVDFHRSRIMQRLGTNSLAKLVRLAVEQRLIPCMTESTPCSGSHIH